MMRMVVAVFIVSLLPMLSCHEADDGTTSPPGGVAFVFGMRGIPDAQGQFVAVTSDPLVLAKLRAELALPASERLLHITGPIARGSGGHNRSWSWHFVPDGWDMVEMSIELCDGSPQGVENGLDYWVDQVGVFCPWGSYVQKKL